MGDKGRWGQTHEESESMPWAEEGGDDMTKAKDGEILAGTEDDQSRPRDPLPGADQLMVPKVI